MSKSPALHRHILSAALYTVTVCCLTGWGAVAPNCEVYPDTACFNPEINSLVAVGNDVATLGGMLRVCLGDTAVIEYASVRIMLVIDRSGSMCENSTNPDDCCAPGDSSGNCMMNDPTNMRIEAAHRFVDSLAQHDPKTEIGVIAFDSRTTTNNPVPLTNEDNIATVHQWIDAASCPLNAPGIVKSSPSPQPLGKTAATKVTNIGSALAAGLQAVDNDFATMPESMSRHIIILTDGAWDDIDPSMSGPDTMINRYKLQFPDRRIPTVHGVFITNAELHTAHGYPPEGCSSGDLIVLGKLVQVTKLTGGLLFPGSTPSTIIANLHSFYHDIIDEGPMLHPPLKVSLSLETATRNGIVINGTTKIAGASKVFEAVLPNFPLEDGLNTITLKRIISLPGSSNDSTVTTTYTIFRDTQKREAPATGPFRVRCVPPQSIVSKNGSALMDSRQPSNTSFNLLGRKVVETDLLGSKATTGVYLDKSKRTGSGKRSISVK